MHEPSVAIVFYADILQTMCALIRNDTLSPHSCGVLGDAALLNSHEQIANRYLLALLGAGRRLPDTHAILRRQVQFAVLGNIERIIKLVDVAHHAVHPELVGGVRIHRNHHLRMLRA